MVRIFSISLSDWVYNTYLDTVNNGNRSKYIEEMIVKGSEIESGEFENNKQKIIRISKEIREKDNIIKKLKTELGKIKSDKKERDFQMDLKMMKGRAMKKYNPAAYPEDEWE